MEPSFMDHKFPILVLFSFLLSNGGCIAARPLLYTNDLVKSMHIPASGSEENFPVVGADISPGGSPEPELAAFSPEPNSLLPSLDPEMSAKGSQLTDSKPLLIPIFGINQPVHLIPFPSGITPPVPLIPFPFPFPFPTSPNYPINHGNPFLPPGFWPPIGFTPANPATFVAGTDMKPVLLHP